MLIKEIGTIAVGYNRECKDYIQIEKAKQPGICADYL